MRPSVRPVQCTRCTPPVRLSATIALESGPARPNLARGLADSQSSGSLGSSRKSRSIVVSRPLSRALEVEVRRCR
jgi:hypothetical protein